MGNKGNDKNLSPYAFTKSKNLELLENLKNGLILSLRSFFFIMFMVQDKLKLEIWQLLLEYLKINTSNKKPLSVVKPGTQTRRFTHINDTVQVCYEAFKANKCKYYSISSKKSYSILNVAKMFNSKINFLNPDWVKDMPLL